ncbi:MAG: hypothetical protein DWQ02_05255 [Bacteroidetes bacterium]|nr:MAG: hypothetical protein DWQ02_05255 [Bacteroidota bacterium]
MKKLTLFLAAIISFSFALPPNNGGPGWEELPKKKKKQFTKSYVYIPSGKLMLENEEEVTVQGFFMYKTEITNLDYQEFVAHVEKSGDKELLEKVRIKPDRWGDENLAKLYHTHPAYHTYPVVNVSHEAAMEYCKWLEGMLAKTYEIDASKINVRLPVKEEWMYAAQGGHQYAPYPWGGYYIRNAKGCYLANFNRAIGEHSVTFNQESGEYEVVNITSLSGRMYTAPAESYHPNDYGLYNMSGNAAEMIHEAGVAMGGSWNSTGYDIRISSSATYETPTPYVGFRPVVTFLGDIN